MGKRHRYTNHYIRELKSYRLNAGPVPAEFRQFFQAKVLPKLVLPGYKRDAKVALAVQLAHNLVVTGLRGACVADGRDCRVPGARMRVTVWDAYVAAGYALVCLGTEEAGRQTRYLATRKLLNLRRAWKLEHLVELSMPRNTQCEQPVMEALVAVHTGRTDPTTGRMLPPEGRRQPIAIQAYIREHAQPGTGGGPDPRAVANGLAYVTALEDAIEEVNRSNTRFGWQAYLPSPPDGKLRVCPVDVRLRQVHVGQLHRGARLYTFGPFGGQGLTKEQRKTLQVGGEQTVELDFECMALRMLYHFNRQDPPGDLYRPELVFPAYHAMENARPAGKAVLRGFVKRCTNICWNVRSRAAANGAVRRLSLNHPHRTFIEKVLTNTEEIRPAAVIDRIMEAHPALAKEFFTGVGMDLMTADGGIMLGVLRAFSEAGKPALALHDAVRVRADDRAFAREQMQRVYRQFLRYNPVINEV